MILYYYGPDTYAAREAIGALAEKERAQIRWLDKEELMEDGPAKWIGQGGGSLFGKEMVVMREPSKLSASGQTELLEALQKSPAGVYVMWDKGEPRKDGPVFKELGIRAQIFPNLGVDRLSGWLVEKAKGLGSAMDLEAARMLVERVGADRWKLTGELEKLALSAAKITVSEVMAAVPEPEQAEIFSVLDALARGEKSKAIKGIQILLKEGSGEFYILAMLAYQIRTLFMVRSGMDRGLKQFEIVKEYKVKQYSVQKCWDAAKRRPATAWRDALTRVLATDYAIKQGKVDARTGVLMLVVGLS